MEQPVNNKTPLTKARLFYFTLLIISFLFGVIIGYQQKTVAGTPTADTKSAKPNDLTPTLKTSLAPTSVKTLSQFKTIKNNGCEYPDNPNIITAGVTGYCSVSIIACKDQGVKPSFKITFPTAWKIGGAGGPGRNGTYFGKSDSIDTYLWHYATPFKLEQIPEVLAMRYTYDLPFEVLNNFPLLPPETKLISTNFKQLGNIRVLVIAVAGPLRYNQNNGEKLIYLFEDPSDSTLFELVFGMENDTPEYQSFIKEVEKVISTLEFTPEIVEKSC